MTIGVTNTLEIPDSNIDDGAAIIAGGNPDKVVTSEAVYDASQLGGWGTGGGGGVPSVNGITGACTIAGPGVSTAGSTITIAGGGGSIYTNIKDYGAVGDGVADDTAAIASAIVATPNGATLYIPHGDYKVIGSGSSIFTLNNNKAINILGEGWGSRIIIDSTVPNTRDVFTFSHTAQLNGVTLRNFFIRSASGTAYGRHAIVFDTSALANLIYVNPRIENVIVYPTNGNSVYIKNSVTNTTGGFAYASIINCNLCSLKGDYVGDNIAIERCTFDNIQQSINLSQISGSGNIRIIGNTLVGNSAIEIGSGNCPIIAENLIETAYTCTQTNNALIDITGAIASVRNPQLLNNQIQVLGFGNPTPIRLASTTNANISGGTLSVITGDHVKITSGSSSAKVGSDQYVTNNVIGSLVMTNAGTSGSAGEWIAYSVTVTSGTGTLGAYTASGYYKIIDNKTAVVSVKIAITTNGTGATNIGFTLPFTAKHDAVICGRETTNTGKMVAGGILAGNSGATVTYYDYTYPGASGNTLVFSGVVERQ